MILRGTKMKRLMFVFCLFSVLLMTNCVNTTVLVSGYIKDSSTNLPIENAKVFDANYGDENYSITNSIGYYSYSTYCEEHMIEVNAEGYEPKKITMITPFIISNVPIALDVTLSKKSNN